MKRRDLATLLLLAAIRGGSFLFVRLGIGAFGSPPIALMRMAGASVVLRPVLHARKRWSDVARHRKPIALVGLTDAALPFIGFAFASRSLGAGMLSIFNASTALFATLIAWLWLDDRLSRLRMPGLAIGFLGVSGLAVAKSGLVGAMGAGTAGGGADAGLAIAPACWPRRTTACR